MVEFKVQMLEQQVQVMQKEINEVLVELQRAMQGMAKANAMVLHLFDDRLKKLEAASDTTSVNNVPQNTEGKEL